MNDEFSKKSKVQLPSCVMSVCMHENNTPDCHFGFRRCGSKASWTPRCSSRCRPTHAVATTTAFLLFCFLSVCFPHAATDGVVEYAWRLTARVVKKWRLSGLGPPPQRRGRSNLQSRGGVPRMQKLRAPVGGGAGEGSPGLSKVPCL